MRPGQVKARLSRTHQNGRGTPIPEDAQAPYGTRSASGW